MQRPGSSVVPRVVKVEILRHLSGETEEKRKVTPIPFSGEPRIAFESNIDSIALKNRSSYIRNNGRRINGKQGSYDMESNGSKIKGQAIDIYI